MTRPPSAYVHGLDGPVVVLSGRTAAWLERHAALRALRTSARGADPQIDAELVALATAAAAWRASATGSPHATEAEPASSSTWLTTRQAADRLGMTDRGVRLAIAAGRLDAHNDGGRWRISREAAAHYRAARQQRAA